MTTMTAEMPEATETAVRPTFVYVTYIHASPEKIWQALTTPEFTRQYWNGQTVRSTWKKGASVEFVKADGTVKMRGEVLEIDPPRSLTYTFCSPHPDGRPADETSRARYEISQAMGVSKLTITHDHFEPDSTLPGKIKEGWPAVLSGLKSLLETGKPLPLD